MKTVCHCLYCPKHPLHDKRGKVKSPTSFEPSKQVRSNGTRAEVDCLSPKSAAFNEFNIDPDRESFPVTAYGDGFAMTGFERDGIVLFATCENEEYVPAARE